MTLEGGRATRVKEEDSFQKGERLTDLKMLIYDFEDRKRPWAKVH